LKSGNPSVDKVIGHGSFARQNYNIDGLCKWPMDAFRIFGTDPAGMFSANFAGMDI
jgi:hypothetical protein